jgi:hypothetical protein
MKNGKTRKSKKKNAKKKRRPIVRVLQGGLCNPK